MHEEREGRVEHAGDRGVDGGGKGGGKGGRIEGRMLQVAEGGNRPRQGMKQSIKRETRWGEEDRY